MTEEGPRAREASEHDDLDEVWSALANPTRREILDLLRRGPQITGTIAAHFPQLSRYAVMQHLEVLETAELVIPRREGRYRWNYLNPVPIQQVYHRWVADYLRPWTEALVRLRDELESNELASSEDEFPTEPTA